MLYGRPSHSFFDVVVILADCEFVLLLLVLFLCCSGRVACFAYMLTKLLMLCGRPSPS
jgi:hypothetical protein